MVTETASGVAWGRGVSWETKLFTVQLQQRREGRKLRGHLSAEIRKKVCSSVFSVISELARDTANIYCIPGQ